MLVLHYTDMASAQEAINRLCDPDAKVSSHYLIDEDGSIYQLVDEQHCAWHAGISYWRGHKNVNNISVGIELANPGHRLGYRPFPIVQMRSLAELCTDIITRHNIASVNVVGHSDIAPLRKLDPGELFDWKWLADRGIGLWPKVKAPLDDKSIPAPIEKLAKYGYELPQNEEHLSKIIEAFQRHFRTSAITGKWDSECDQLLAGLIEMI